jgi:deazaflavin-dependent oxidoreductase (nitroreductase family)
MVNFSEIQVIKQHIELYRTDPEKAQRWDSTVAGGPGPVPTLLLTTTGRRSGRPRAAPLIYGEAGGSYVVIDSKAGMSTHPLWYLNLDASPECELMVGRKAVSAKARVAEGEERERLWQQMAKLYSPYDQYQERAGARTIPVVVLGPMG